MHLIDNEFVVFSVRLQDAFFYLLRVCRVPRFGSGRPERGGVSHRTAEEMQRQLLLDGVIDRLQPQETVR